MYQIYLLGVGSSRVVPMFAHLRARMPARLHAACMRPIHVVKNLGIRDFDLSSLIRSRGETPLRNELFLLR